MNTRIFCLVALLLTPSAFGETAGNQGTLTIDAVAFDLKPETHLAFKLTAAYVAFDTSKTKPRSDGGVPVAESQAAFRTFGKPVPIWLVDVPESGKVKPQQFTMKFDRPFAIVPAHTTAVTLKIDFSQLVYGEQGKMKPMARTLTLPIPVPPGGAVALRRCLIAQGLPDGSLNVRIAEHCPPPAQASPHRR